MLSAIPTYFMSVFRLPVGICKHMEAIMGRFFWQGTETTGTRGRALVKWSAICRPMKEGGLGVVGRGRLLWRRRIPFKIKILC